MIFNNTAESARGSVKKLVLNPTYVSGTINCHYNVNANQYSATITATINAEMLGKAYIIAGAIEGGHSMPDWCLSIAPDLTTSVVSRYLVEGSSNVVYDAASRTFTWSFISTEYINPSGTSQASFIAYALEI